MLKEDLKKLSWADKAKIIEFREAFRKVINPQNRADTNKVVDSLFYNVECNYAQYKDAVPFVSAKQERYGYHILKPVNGRYSLLDFLLNRAMTNVECVDFTKNENTYDNWKAVLIQKNRYEEETKKGIYSPQFIAKQYEKSRLHETGHAMHVWDTIDDGEIHSKESDKSYASWIGLFDKVEGMEKLLRNRYPNLLHSSEIKNKKYKEYSIVKRSCPFRNRNLDEAVTEYFATKYSGLYDDLANYIGINITTYPEEMMIAVPNPFNGYGQGAKYMYHFENLVSKQAMFNSTFFESDEALREFSIKYKSHIQHSLKDSGYFESNGDTYQQFTNLLGKACNYEVVKQTKQDQQDTFVAQQVLDNIFAAAYHDEHKKGNISDDKMKEIAKISFSLSTIAYHSDKQAWVDSTAREWYAELYNKLKDSEEKANAGKKMPTDSDGWSY